MKFICETAYLFFFVVYLENSADLERNILFTFRILYKSSKNCNRMFLN
jgi:hypothetical protein